MGWRFRRSIRIVPGVRVNLGLTRASFSVGPRGFTYNVGSKASRVTVGLPGTGLSYTQPTAHQSPVALVSNAMEPARRFSATPLVIVAFIIALIYLAATNDQHKPVAAAENTSVTETAKMPEVLMEDVAGSVVQLPRPRPKMRGEGAGLPLQIIPQK
jgi:hypothetical protein